MSDSTTRRGFLRGTAGATAESGADLSTWFEDVDNYDGVEDRTSEDEVTVAVGAEGNGGAFAFDPPAVRIDPGTTVVWEWTGEGGSHDVVANNGAFESEMVGDEGHTIEYTPEESGVVKYVCTPHETMGMKGALVVGDAEIGGSGDSGTKVGPWTATVGGSILLGLLSPLAFAAFLFGRDPDRPQTES